MPFRLSDTSVMPNDLTGNQAVKIWLIQHDRKHRWLARQLNVSDATLSKILTGRVTPSPVVLRKLRKLTGIDLTTFAQVA